MLLKVLIAKHKLLWSDKSFVVLAAAGFLFIVGSLFVNYGAIIYSAKEAGNSTTDILLDNIPVINTDIVFSEGALVFALFAVFLLVIKPKTIPFILKSVALFFCIRSIFLVMTHIGPYPDHIITDINNFKYLSSGADLFFSGHTGLPFLLALLFWENKYLRTTFLICSVVAAVAAIFGHLHYTIDVFSAYFVTYGIYHIARRLFIRDYSFFKYGLVTNDRH